MAQIQNLYTHEPDWISPPGDTLLEVIQSKGITPQELAERTGVDLEQIDRIIEGVDAITPTMATHLEHIVGVSARFWNTLEENYQTQKEIAPPKYPN